MSFDSLQAELGEMEIPHQVRTRLLHLVGSFGGQRLYVPKRDTVFAERLHEIAKLVGSGMSGPEIVDAVRSRYGVSTGTAYRLINRARLVKHGRVA
jgi:Mor family transcriptional regulator